MSKRARSSSSYPERPFKSTPGGATRQPPRDINTHDTTIAKAAVQQASAAALTTFGSLVSAIPRGQTSVTRLGRNARLLSLYGEITVSRGGVNTPPQPPVINICLIYEKSHQKAATAPDLAQIYEIGESTSNLFRKLEEVKNYSVLMRKTVIPEIDYESASTSAHSIHIPFKHKFKKEGEVFNYSGENGVLGECIDGCLYLVAFSDLAAAESGIHWSARTRIKFMP